MLREAEVRDLDVAVKIEQDVLRLEVAVDDVERVQVVERERDLGRVELGYGVRESLEGTEVSVLSERASTIEGLRAECREEMRDAQARGTGYERDSRG